MDACSIHLFGRCRPLKCCTAVYRKPEERIEEFKKGGRYYMAKSTTPSFVVTRRIITDDRGYDKLNKIMRITERMYNAGVRHCIKQLNKHYADS